MTEHNQPSQKVTELVKNTMQNLAIQFPRCFVLDDAKKKPLKVGILRDLYRRCPGTPADLLRKALLVYCSSPNYVSLLKNGDIPLVDLDGYEFFRNSKEGAPKTEHPAEASAATG